MAHRGFDQGLPSVRSVFSGSSSLRRRSDGVWLAGAALAAVLGCQRSDSQLGRVEGVVRLDGQPLASGQVIFQPASGRGAQGTIRPDGTFTLGTYGETDGALVGEHRVAIVAYAGATQGRPDPTAQRAAPKPLVPERYLAVGTSGLTYEVKPGKNQPEFNLESR